jgi:hypothetical protein
MSLRNLFIAALLGFAFLYGLGAVSSASAQQDGMVISVLSCATDPEAVTISNEGATAQDMQGWRLESDPVDQQSFDLSAVGSLPPSASVTITSGPAAGGIFVWSQEFVFRDDDPTDFARLVDADGNIVDEVACAATDARPDDGLDETPDGLPVGGGPPGTPGGGSVLPLVAGGGVLAAAGALVIAVTFLLGAGVRAVPSTGPAGESVAPAAVRQRTRGLGGLLPYLAIAALVLFLAVNLRDR